jgi:hypothetical protein
MQNPAEHADRGGLAARTGHTDAEPGRVEELGEKPRPGGDGGTNTTRGLHVGDSLLNGGGRDQDLTRPGNATTILRMKQHAMRTQKVKSLGVTSLIKRAVGTFNPSTPGLDDQGERGHAATPDAAEKVISKVGHWRNLKGLLMRCNAGQAIG